MTPEDRGKLKIGIARLAACFRVDADQLTLDGYVGVLEDFPAEQSLYALGQAAKMVWPTGMPSAANIRELVEVARTRRAALLRDEAQKAMRAKTTPIPPEVARERLQAMRDRLGPKMVNAFPAWPGGKR